MFEFLNYFKTGEFWLIVFNVVVICWTLVIIFWVIYTIFAPVFTVGMAILNVIVWLPISIFYVLKYTYIALKFVVKIIYKYLSFIYVEIAEYCASYKHSLVVYVALGILVITIFLRVIFNMMFSYSTTFIMRELVIVIWTLIILFFILKYTYRCLAFICIKILESCGLIVSRELKSASLQIKLLAKVLASSLKPNDPSDDKYAKSLLDIWLKDFKEDIHYKLHEIFDKEYENKEIKENEIYKLAKKIKPFYSKKELEVYLKDFIMFSDFPFTLDKKVKEGLREICRGFNLDVELIDTFALSKVESYCKGLNPFEILQLDDDATREDLKKRFHQMAKQLHPDVFNANDLNPVEQKIVTERFRRIKDAYEEILSKVSNS